MKTDELHIGRLPDLKIVSLAGIRFHEFPDENISRRLTEKIRKDGFLKNPPIVAVTGKEDLILLDGTNRVNALSHLGIRDVCVQLISIDDPLFTLASWSHAVEKPIQSELIQCLNSHGIRHGDERSIDSDLLVDVVFREGKRIQIPRQNSLEDSISLLKEITALYLHQGRMDRVSYSDLPDLERNYPAFSALFNYSGIRKDQLVDIALNGIKIPSGITRIRLPKRALHFNMPLSILAGEKPLDQKNNWLSNNILERIRSKSIRFYEEPTFIFDE